MSALSLTVMLYEIFVLALILTALSLPIVAGLLLDAKNRWGIGGFFLCVLFPLPTLIYACFVPALPPRAVAALSVTPVGTPSARPLDRVEPFPLTRSGRRFAD